jgi:hypothetical protein
MPGNRPEEDSGCLIPRMVLSAILKGEAPKPARGRNTHVDQSLSASALSLPRRNVLRVIWSSRVRVGNSTHRDALLLSAGRLEHGVCNAQ